MIVKIFKAGKSFKSLTAYLTHDVKNRETKERVAWTLSRNCTFDDPDSVVHEMLWTYRAAEDLKRAAGVKPGGRKLENPVRHMSLNWHPSERPTREQMLEAVDSFLAHMGWQEHQALLVRHTDREHAHVHIILNAVHPETGLALDDSLERRRAQRWAKQYEREHELVWCEERLKPQEERTPSPTRKSWEILRETGEKHDRVEIERVAKDAEFFRLSPEELNDREWQALKAQQRHEREQFFMDGKQAYRAARTSVFREVRTEFREEWRLYYAAGRAGVDANTLAEIKEGILADQNAILKERGDNTTSRLREERDREYDELLKRQQLERDELRLAQERGERSYELLDPTYSAMSPIDASEREELGSGAAALSREFRRAAAEITDEAVDDAPRIEPEISGNDASGGGKGRDAMDAAGAFGEGMVKILGAIAESLSGGDGRGRQPMPADRGPSLSDEERERARRAAEQKSRAEEQEREALALKAYWEERRERRRERD